MPIVKKTSLFRVNSCQKNFSSFHICSGAEATVNVPASTLPCSPISNRMTQDPDHFSGLLHCCQITVRDQTVHFLFPAKGNRVVVRQTH